MGTSETVPRLLTSPPLFIPPVFMASLIEPSFVDLYPKSSLPYLTPLAVLYGPPSLAFEDYAWGIDAP